MTNFLLSEPDIIQVLVWFMSSAVISAICIGIARRVFNK